MLRRVLRFAGAPRGLLGFASTSDKKLDAIISCELDLDLLQRVREEFRREDPMLISGRGQ